MYCASAAADQLFAGRRCSAAALHASMEFVKLTRRHGVKIASKFKFSVEECSLAVGKVVGNSSVKSAARMNSAIVIFVDSIDKANTLVENGVVIKNTFVPITPLATSAKKVIISNVPPFIRDEVLARELSRHGKIMSPIKKVHSGCKAPELKHVVSHRRQLHMILNNNEEMNLAFKLKVDDFDYVIFATSEQMKCFICKSEGHLARACPEKEVRLTEENVQIGEEHETDEMHQDRQVGGAEGGEASENGHEKQESETGKGEAVNIQQNSKENETPAENSQNQLRLDQLTPACTVNIQQDSQGSGTEQGETQDSQVVSETGQETTSENQQDSQVNEKRQEKAMDPLFASGMVFGSPSVLTKKQNDNCQESVGNVVLGEEEVEMENEADLFKVPMQLKRKNKNSKGSSKAKKGVASKIAKDAVKQPSESDSSYAADSESECSDVMAVSQVKYTVQSIQSFLLKTKNKKQVKVEDYFSDRESFSESVRHHMSNKGEEGFTSQEIFRLRKILSKVTKELNDGCEDE